MSNEQLESAVDTAVPATNYERYQKFEADLSSLLNKHSMEGFSDTPDFILARYLVVCLMGFTQATEARDNFYGEAK